jgi:hypothetical protein
MSPASTNHAKWLRRGCSSVIAAVGFVLSPLSWWNDLVVNVPIAWLFAWPFSAWDERLYVPAFVLGYWLTNILGLILLHKGIVGAISDKKTSLRSQFIAASVYTAVIAIAAWLGWLPSPTQLLGAL